MFRSKSFLSGLARLYFGVLCLGVLGMLPVSGDATAQSALSRAIEECMRQGQPNRATMADDQYYYWICFDDIAAALLSEMKGQSTEYSLGGRGWVRYVGKRLFCAEYSSGKHICRVNILFDQHGFNH